MVIRSLLWLSIVLGCLTSFAKSHTSVNNLEDLIDERINVALEKVTAANQAQISALEKQFARREHALLSQIVQLQHNYEQDISQLREQIGGGNDQHVRAHSAADENRKHEKRGVDGMVSKDIIPVLKQGSFRRASGQAQLAFFAVGPDFDFSNMAINQSITYAPPTTNIGAAFHAAIGQFIAPLSGTYAFFVTVCGHLNANNHFNVDYSGKIMAKLFLGPTLEQSSQTVIITMQAGERLSVRSGGYKAGVYGSPYTSIAGFLLYESSGPVPVGK